MDNEVNEKVFEKGIFFDEEKHIYTNEFGEKYISGTKFISLFYEAYDAPFWLIYKAAEKVLVKDKTLLTTEQLDFLNKTKTKKSKEFTLEESNIFDFYKRVYLCTNNKEWFLDKIQNHPLYQEVLEESYLIREDWDNKSLESTIKGSAYHKSEEDKTIAEENCVSVMGQDLSFPFLCGGTFPELNLYNHDAKLAGTADRVKITKDGKGGFILDYKTSKTLDFQSFTSPYLNKGSDMFEMFGVTLVEDFSSKMKYPINHLDNCNYIHYALQLNLYSWFLKKLGYNIDKRMLQKVSFNKTDYVNPKSIGHFEIPNMEMEIEVMVNYFKQNKEALLCPHKN